MLAAGRTVPHGVWYARDFWRTRSGSDRKNKNKLQAACSCSISGRSSVTRLCLHQKPLKGMILGMRQMIEEPVVDRPLRLMDTLHCWQ